MEIENQSLLVDEWRAPLRDQSCRPQTDRQRTGMGAKQANEAILAAHRTFGEWREKTAHERAQMLQRWFELVVQNTEDLARLMACEQGKPLSESRNEISLRRVIHRMVC